MLEFEKFEIYLPNLFIGLGLIFGFLDFQRNTHLKNYIKYIIVILIFGVFFAALFQNIYFSDFEFIGKHGLTFYGGFFGFLLSIVFINKFNLIKTYYTINYFIDPLLLTHSFWRISCFYGGCCYGIQIDNFLFERLPIQLIESLILLIGYFISKNYIKNDYKLVFYLLYYPFFRIFIEMFRADDRGILFVSYLSPSQTISFILIIFAIVLIYLHAFINRHSRKIR